MALIAGLVLFEESDVPTGGDHDQKDGTKGFAGLSSLVSDVDATVLDAGRREEAPLTIVERATPGTTVPPTTSHLTQETSTYKAPQQLIGGSPGKWFLWIALVIGLICLVSLSSKKPSGSSPAYSAPTVSLAVPTAPPALEPTNLPVTQALSRLTEIRPPVGSGNTLTSPQLRYCTVENIRLDAVKVVINRSSDADIDRFNALVADYNNRCGKFQYQRGALESARADVEPYRGEIEVEGRSRFALSSVPSVPVDLRPEVSVAEPPVKTQPDLTVKLIQIRLNKFGYEAGTEDGLTGEKTRAAITSFQRSQRIHVDGNPSPSLLKLLTEYTGSVKLTPAQPQAVKPPSMAPSAISPANQSGSSESSGRPDLSKANKAEQTAIERTCENARQYSGPIVHYACLNRELSNLQSSGGRPDLSRLNSVEGASIERACDSARQYSGPGTYYACLNREMVSIRSSGGKPSLLSATPSEQVSIERACDSARQYSGPGTYYACLNREMVSVRSSGGKPSLLSATPSEQVSIERACDSARQYSGPGTYYACLHREINRLSQR